MEDHYKDGNISPLKESRAEIDTIDSEILALFQKRMDLCAKIGEEKQAHGLPLEHPEREREILLKVTKDSPSDLAASARMLFSTLFELSKAYQRRLTPKGSEFARTLQLAAENAEHKFPESARIACCGLPGAYAQIAADRMFPLADISYFNSFSAVFQAVEKDFCSYGVLPVENSSAGTVDAVYDLMKDHKFYIVRSLRLKVRHSLLLPPGVELAGVKEVISHEQALKQCSIRLNQFGDIKQTTAPSTAWAARYAATCGRKDVAVIASPECAPLYGLTLAERSIQNNDFNFTRFICISKKPEIYHGSDRISIMAALPHKAGSLNSLLSRFAALGLNLTKLESRPIPGEDFEYLFYFDFEADLMNEEVRSLLAELSEESENFVFLGNYRCL